MSLRPCGGCNRHACRFITFFIILLFFPFPTVLVGLAVYGTVVHFNLLDYSEGYEIGENIINSTNVELSRY